MEESTSDSQNFCLKLSPYSAISDTHNIVTNNEKDIILISDSSSNCSSPKCYPKSKSNKPTSSSEIYISSDSDCTDDENKKFFQTWKVKKKDNVIRYKLAKDIIANKNNALYTSDETSSSSNEQSKRYIQSSSKSSNSYTSSTLKSSIKVASKTDAQFYSNKKNKDNNMLSSCTATNNDSKSSNMFDQLLKASSINKKNYNNITTKLTRKDTRNILKNIKATQIIYDSPRRQKECSTVINESIDDEGHPAISFKGNLETRNKIIDETIDSEDDVIPDSQVNAINCPKSYDNKFVDAPDAKKNKETMCTELSERKKKQISQWLMTNSPDSKSDSSFSIVPASNRTDMSSGNSSLERMEMNYETPNNRGKIHIAPSSGKRMTNQNHTPQPRQTTIHEFTQRSKDNALELRRSKNNNTNNACLTPRMNTPQNTNVMNCADILDKLYGTSWRDKADILLPNSEPRKQGVPTVHRAVQTER